MTKLVTQEALGKTMELQKTYIDKKITDVVGAAPEALDTLQEIAAQLQNDESAATALTGQLTQEIADRKAADSTLTSLTNYDVNYFAYDSQLGKYKPPYFEILDGPTVSSFTKDSLYYGNFSSFSAIKPSIGGKYLCVSSINAQEPGSTLITQDGYLAKIYNNQVTAVTNIQYLSTLPTLLASKQNTLSVGNANTQGTTKLYSSIGTNSDGTMTQAAINTELNKKVDIQTQINEYPLTGNITLTKADIGLSRVDDTSDISKPVSTAQQAALDEKLDKSSVKQAIGTSTTDVMSQKAVADAIKAVTDAIADSLWYGIEFDTAVSSPTCTRIGNSDLHKTLPIQSSMKGCLLDDNGNVVEYLNSTDWTSNVRDGSRGQVMVELPMYYRKFETDGTKLRVRMSTLPLPGYTRVEKKYVSAYQATVDRSVSATPKLCSIVNEGTSYRGGTNNASYDGKSNTLLGRPASNISRTNFRIYARNRNSGDTEWNCMTYDIQKDLYWLFVVEYATINTQAAYNAKLTTEGFRQGGLGDGVSTLDGTKWNTFNGYNPFIPCGYTDELGNGTGYVEFTMPTEYDSTTTKKVQVPRYRGIENPFGHIWQWTDGINVQIQAGGTGKSNIYTCDDPRKFNDSNYDGYNLIGQEARTGGYVKKIVFGEYGDIMPTEVGGSNTTYYCDYHYTNIPTVETLRGVRFGGNAYDGANCGFVFALSSNAPSFAYSDIGSRLCFIPRTA